jgi:hypothetical protein
MSRVANTTGTVDHKYTDVKWLEFLKMHSSERKSKEKKLKMLNICLNGDGKLTSKLHDTL